MTILLTGCAGFIGSNLTEKLLDQNFSVIGIDNYDSYYARSIKMDNLNLAFKHPNFKFFEVDIRDELNIDKILGEHKIDIIIHLAARAGVRPSIENPLLYADVNVKGTTVLLEACKNYNIKKFVFASSSSVYGNNISVPFKETDNVDYPISPYAATKKAGELICYTYHKLYNIDISCLRFFTVYGPRQRPEMAISLFIRKIKNNEEIQVFSNGQTSRDYTFIDDITEGVILASKKLSGYNIFNIGGSSPIKLNDLIAVIEKKVGVTANIKYLEGQPGDVELTYADAQLAENSIGFKASITIEEGISKYLNWLGGKN